VVFGLIPQAGRETLLQTAATESGKLPASTARERAQLLKGQLEALVVEAKRLQMDLGDVQAALSEHWERLGYDARSSSERKGERS